MESKSFTNQNQSDVFYPNTPQQNPPYPQPNGAPVYRPVQPQPAPYVPYIPMKKTYDPLTKKDNVFVFVFLLVSFLLTDFALFRGFHLGFTISYAVLFLISTIFIRNKQQKTSAFALACGVISLAGSVTFALYNNTFINVIMFILICGLFTVYCLGISGSFKRKQGNFKMLFDLVQGSVIEPFANLSDIIGSIKATAGKDKKHISTILGIVIALPVLFVIIPLLIESDAAFEGLISSIVKNLAQYLVELLVAVIFLPFLYSYMFGKKNRLNKAKIGSSDTDLRKIPISGCVSFLCMISVTYLVYLFSQLAYFFSAFKGLLPEGYSRTASEFARRGFFEMFAICVINIIIISLVNAFTKRDHNGKNSAAVKILSLFISLFSVVLVISAMQKMKLNISTYGFTMNRLLVTVFMMMMLVVIAFFILHIFAPKISYMQPIILICSCMFVALSFANIDAFTIEQNTRAYQNGTMEELDVYTISGLGDAAIPYLIDFAESDDKEIAKTATLELAELVSYDEDIEYKENLDGTYIVTVPKEDFRSYCKTKDDAMKELEAYCNDKNNTRFHSFLKLYDDGYYAFEDDVFYLYNGDEYHYNETSESYEKIPEPEMN